MAAQKLETGIARFLDEPGSGVLLVRASTGLGKTELLLQEITQRGLRAVYAVPTHVLSAEIAARLEALVPGIEVVVWYGREAPNPDTDRPMCSRLDRIASIRKKMARLTIGEGNN